MSIRAPSLQKWGHSAPGFSRGLNGPSRLTVRMPYAHTVDMRKTFKYRLDPNKQQQHLLEHQLEECRWLYNHLLVARRDAWQERQESVRLYAHHPPPPPLPPQRPPAASLPSPRPSTPPPP